MSFVGDTKRIESMLKDNATAFSGAGNMLFGPKYEELVAKHLSSKNRSKELFGSIKNQGSSKERSRRKPSQNGHQCRSRGNREREIFTAVDQSLQQQYLAGGQGRGKNEFINSTFHQVDEPSVCIIILRSTSTSSEFISGKNQATDQSRQSETFCKESAKTEKRSYDTGYSKRLRNLFYFVAKAIKATKSVSFNQRSVRPSGSRGPGHVEEGCYSIFGSQGGPISKLFVSFEKERWGESPSSQPKEPEQKYSVSALQGGRVVPIKRNVVTRGPNVQDRPQGCILRNPRKILEVRQIPVERPIRVLLPLLRAFSSSSRFYKAIKSPYLSLLRKLNIRTIIYLDDILLMASLLEDLLMARDTLIFILQHLGFLINTKKSYIEPTSTLEFLGVIPDSGEMTLNLPKEKRLKVQNHCQES